MCSSILIYDSDPDLIELETKWFSHAGYRVSGTTNPDCVLAWLAEKEFHVVILGADIPFALLARLINALNQYSPSVPWILHSRFGTMRVMVKSFGAFGALELPCAFA